MNSPSSPVWVRCPNCEHEYREWIHEAELDGHDDDPGRIQTSTCPECGFRLSAIEVIEQPNGTWQRDQIDLAPWDQP